jgi:hypothetical protein
MNEISNKLTAFGGEGCQHSLYIHIVKGLIEMLNSTNEMVKLFRSARDSCFHYDNCNYKLRLLGRRLDDVRQFDDPTSTYIGGLAVGDIGDPFSNAISSLKAILVVSNKFLNYIQNLWRCSTHFFFLMVKMDSVMTPKENYYPSSCKRC